MERVTAESVLGLLVQRAPAVLQVLHRYGMSCGGCAGIEWETVAEAARRHRIDLRSFLVELNRALAEVTGTAMGPH